MSAKTIILLAVSLCAVALTAFRADAGRDAFDVVGVDDYKRLSLYTSGGLAECRPCQDPDDWNKSEAGACFNECLADTLGLFVGCEAGELTFELSPLSAEERDIFATRLVADSEVKLMVGGLQISTVITTMTFSLRGYDDNWSMQLRGGHPDIVVALADKLRRAKPTGKMEVSFGPFTYFATLLPEELLAHMLGLASECER